ncbi:MAG: hypothetical protein V1779_11560 [bacterium]
MKNILFLLLVLLLFSCTYYSKQNIKQNQSYQPPLNYDFDNSKIINKPFDEVWILLIEWFAKTGIPIKNMDKSSGFIATESKLKSDYSHCDCGQISSMSSIDNISGKFNVLVKKISDNSTSVVIYTFFQATIKTKTVFSNNISYDFEMNDCNSKGTLELNILEYLNK